MTYNVAVDENAVIIKRLDGKNIYADQRFLVCEALTAYEVKCDNFTYVDKKTIGIKYADCEEAKETAGRINDALSRL